MDWKKRGLEITNSKHKINLEAVFNYLHTSAYWCKGIPYEIVKKSIENSVSFTVLFEDEFAGFARLVTDHATFAYVCDLFIGDKFRGRGYGKFLVKCINEWIELNNIRTALLLTQDAQNLYKKYDWTNFENPNVVMRYKDRNSNFYK